MSHTPGPWRVKGRRIEYGPSVAGDGWNVAEVRSDYHEPLEANARLIAAAPALLVACVYALNELKYPHPNPENRGLTIKEIESAIAQAEEGR